MFYMLGRTAAALAALVLLQGGVSLARPAAPSPRFRDAGPSILGTLTAVDIPSSRVRVRPEGREADVELSLAPDVEVARGGRGAPVSTLATLEGRRVKVRYVEERAELMAWAVTVESAPRARPRAR